MLKKFLLLGIVVCSIGLLVLNSSLICGQGKKNPPDAGLQVKGIPVLEIDGVDYEADKVYKVTNDNVHFRVGTSYEYEDVHASDVWIDCRDGDVKEEDIEHLPTSDGHKANYQNNSGTQKYWTRNDVAVYLDTEEPIEPKKNTIIVWAKYVKVDSPYHILYVRKRHVVKFEKDDLEKNVIITINGSTIKASRTIEINGSGGNQLAVRTSKMNDRVATNLLYKFLPGTPPGPFLIFKQQPVEEAKAASPGAKDGTRNWQLSDKALRDAAEKSEDITMLVWEVYGDIHRSNSVRFKCKLTK